MYKHVAKHNDKKTVLLWRQVPGEDHMCLVAYSDLLPRIYHDAVMKVLESDMGQQAENFSDALFRSMMPDGRNCLEALHRDGLIKKVPANQVIVTPTASSSVRLDELNKILNEMATGQSAIDRMAKLDGEYGYAKAKKPTGNKVIEPVENTILNEGVLSDKDLAQDRLKQAATMKASAAQLMAEAERLVTEATALDPTTTIATNDNPIPKKKATIKVKKD